ncbi:unnamed protein product [Toxocara canis]|uniref:DNA-directed RNA polymerase n=1 Tax=Toxocara canis TaxID=6265 RepID=A0A183U435_TOXCA|nr:unnamed protein product [Toxocara canis]
MKQCYCFDYSLISHKLPSTLKPIWLSIQICDFLFQSFKYFEAYADEIRSSVLSIHESVESVGRNQRIQGLDLSSQKHRICVHIRRGDFVKSTLHMESREEFVVWAVNHIIHEGWLLLNHLNFTDKSHSLRVPRT